MNTQTSKSNTQDESKKIKKLHTEEEKKRYGKIEKIIKRTLNELLLLNKTYQGPDAISRGLSITKNFNIRELNALENDKYIANLANIKSATIAYVEREKKEELFKILDSKISDKEIVDEYKKGIDAFFWRYLIKPRAEYRSEHPLYKRFQKQYYQEYKNKKLTTEKINVILKVGQLLENRLGEAAFKEENGKLVVSFDALKYLRNIFRNINVVWRQIGGDVGQVFHDGDFPFIIDGDIKDFNSYVEVFVYLLSHDKDNPFGKRGEDGDKERTKKTGQYTDMLWACTDPALGFHEAEFLKRESPEFQRNDTVQKTFKRAADLLQVEVDVYNKKHNKNYIMTSRLKSLPSCIEKKIEGKEINDIMGFRVSTLEGAKYNYDDIMHISKNWLSRLSASMDGVLVGGNKANFNINSIALDNKKMFSEGDVNNMVEELQSIAPTKIREKRANPYIKKEKWEARMAKHYKKITERVNTKDDDWYIISRHYDNFTGGNTRGSNGGYKDFKANVVAHIQKEGGEGIALPIELQFDDVSNNKGLANFNIRNAERAVNTASNSVFSKPLKQIRKTIATHVKRMASWVGDKGPSFGVIDFGNGVIVDVSSFVYRNPINGADIDKVVVEIINYFIKEGRFLLYADEKQKSTNLQKRLLTTGDLYDDALIEGIHICSLQGLAKLQHSYLLNIRDGKVGIYLPETGTIGWMKMGEVVDYMNLGKIKTKEYALIDQNTSKK